MALRAIVAVLVALPLWTAACAGDPEPGDSCASQDDCAPALVCDGPPGCAVAWTCRVPDGPAWAPGSTFCRPPTADIVLYCGCDGTTRRGATSCPPGPYRYKGTCEDPCWAAWSDPTGGCWNDYDEPLDSSCCAHVDDAGVDDGGADAG